jgi:hypothetical protein
LAAIFAEEAGVASCSAAVKETFLMRDVALASAVDSPRSASAPPSATVTLTSATPEAIMPMLAAAAFDRSMILPPMKGPRSLMRTITDRPFERFSTKTRVPNGNDRCAAVSSSGFIRSPFAVLLAGKEYQERGAVGAEEGNYRSGARSPPQSSWLACEQRSYLRIHSWEGFKTGEETGRFVQSGKLRRKKQSTWGN